MYKLGDKRAAIREIQKYLNYISDRTGGEIPRVAIDGFFGEETKKAVKAFQKEMGIYESGEVDYGTFTLLYEEYLIAVSGYEAEKYFIDQNLFPFKLGDMGREALYINLMLDELSKVFGEIGRVDLKPYFSISSESAVMKVRDIFMMDASPYVDLELFQRMRYELKIRGGANNLR